MLAEKIFNTNLQLPEELQSRAVVLAREMAWSAPDALRVVAWLAAHNIAIAGVELWRDAGGAPRWLAGGSCTSDSPAECAREAAKLIRDLDTSQPQPDNLFNLSW